MSKCRSYRLLRGFLASNKNVSFVHRLNRDLQCTFFKPQPAAKTNGHLQGWWASLANREVEKVSNTPLKTYIDWLSTMHTGFIKQRKHLQVRRDAATSGAASCALTPISDLPPPSSQRSLGIKRQHWRKSWPPLEVNLLAGHLGCQRSIQRPSTSS